MSAKRAATTELNHDNWDKEDPADQEEMGTYKAAAKEELEKRVFKTARRRTTMAGGDEGKKSVFSGFGFNKTQPKSFDFLANLTNGSKTNGSASKNENTVSSSIFTNSSLVTGTSSGLFTIPVSNTAPKTTSTFGTASTPSLFGISSSSTSSAVTNTSPMMPSKADSTVLDSPFNKPPSSSKSDAGGFQLKSGSNSLPQVSSTIAASTNKSLFSSSGSNSGSTPFKIHPVTSTTTSSSSAVVSKPADKKTEGASDSKMAYYSKLKGLNESVSDWINKHVEETPLCILTPIFNDYEKYLKEIQEEYHKAGGGNEAKKDEKTSNSTPKPTSSLFTSTSTTTNLITPKVASAASAESASQPFSFGIKTSSVAPSTTASSTPGFSFGINSPAKDSTEKSMTSPFGANKPATSPFGGDKSTTSPFGGGTSTKSPFGGDTSSKSPFGGDTSTKSPFGGDKTSASPFGAEKAFGANKLTPSPFSTDKPASTPFSFSSNPTNGPKPQAPFSFGIGQKFSFSPNTQQKPDESNEQKNEDDEEPPKVEFTPVVEENSVFDKRCKIFVKKDGNFADKGVGTLYIKKIEDSAKHQLIVRANTNLGTVLVNLVLASAIPTQRMGKNNVMMVCIPTPDAKPPPTPILIRVKTSEEADDLLETLNKFKG